jgi:hypothetical protein
MRAFLIILFLLLNQCFSQNINNFNLEICKTKVDSLSSSYFKNKSNKINFNYSYEKSYLLLDNTKNNYETCDTCKIISHKKLSEIKELSKIKIENLVLVYDIKINNKYSGSFNFSFDNNNNFEKKHIEITLDELNNYKKLVNGNLVRINKIYKIIKSNGIKNIDELLLTEDPEWKENDYYEEDEKNWKLVWIVKEKNISKPGYSVIKIDAKKGNILTKFIEFIVD